MNYLNYILLAIFLLPFTVYSKTPAKDSDIRGYTFGEKISFVLNKEYQQKEYKLLPLRTNENQLVYQGSLFNEPVVLIYHFRKNRLSSLSYIWQNVNNDVVFYRYLQKLLKSKYEETTTKQIQALTSDVTINTYIQSITNSITDSNTNKKIVSPTLYIGLEKISSSNSNQTFILEFKAYDSDQTIKNKILSEDI